LINCSVRHAREFFYFRELAKWVDFLGVQNSGKETTIWKYWKSFTWHVIDLLKCLPRSRLNIISISPSRGQFPAAFPVFFHRVLFFFSVLGAWAAYLFIMWDSLGYSSHVLPHARKLHFPGLSPSRTERNGSKLCIIRGGLKIMSTRLLLDSGCRSISVDSFCPVSLPKLARNSKAKRLGETLSWGEQNKKW